ncbi:ribose-phosphate pyrophosphokinase [Sandarakinorhabdus sp. DWP1-3-1]|uniref:ribose-phosphate pyrophosphokinase n=1 Tax=Sandarakinorhabdus sp. DWP1-3-1 TaxID=2804627 RepID=UPI003CFB2E97
MAIADLSDIDHIEALLQASARAGAAMSYSEILLALGHRFTRPKMRALCNVLDVVDRRAAAAGQPELAVLVVREGDGLPGQGWWVGRDAPVDSWTGAAARALVAQIQQRAFDYWGKAPA